jgi:hypothetical protein
LFVKVVVSLEYLTARQFAKLSGIPERTVRGWLKGREVPGVEKLGKAWAAKMDTWKALAAEDRKPGRRDNVPRTKKPAPNS